MVYSSRVGDIGIHLFIQVLKSSVNFPEFPLLNSSINLTELFFSVQRLTKVKYWTSHTNRLF